MEDKGQNTALDLLMAAGERPQVEPRGDSLLKESNVTELVVPKDKQPIATSIDLASIEEELAALPKTSFISAQLRSDLLEELRKHLRQAGISREVWLEAALALALTRPDVMEEIGKEAKQRHLQRQSVKKQKAALTRLKNAFSVPK